MVATALAMVLGSMAAFALSRYAFRGREGLFLLFTAGLLFPLNTAALLLQKIGLNDNLFGVALPEAAFSLPVTIVILRPFMRAVPRNWRTRRPWTAPPGSVSSCGSCCRCPGPP